MDNNTLKPGDKIYKINYGSIVRVVTIDRVTRTQAITKDSETKFRINLSSSGSAKEIGNSDRWDTGHWWLENDQLKEKLFDQKLVGQIKKIEFSTLPIDKIKKILSIVDEQ